MSNPSQRFITFFKLLATLMLTLSALGFLLIPGRLGTLIHNIPVIFYILLGVIFFIVGLISQTSVFIEYRKSTQIRIDITIAFCLGILSFLFFRARLLLDGVVLAFLVCGQLYVLFFRDNYHSDVKNFWVIGYAGLNLISGLMFLTSLTNLSGLDVLRQYRFVFGAIFLLGSIANIVTYSLIPKKESNLLYKFAGAPWIIWVIASAWAFQVDAVLVGFGLAFLPLFGEAIIKQRQSLPDNDYIGHRIIWITNVAELLMLVALTATGYNAQNLTFFKTLFSNGSLTQTNQDVSFIVMVAVKSFSLYGAFIVASTIKRLSVQLSTPGYEENDYENSPFKGWSHWIARSLKSFASPSQSLLTKVEIQAEQIIALSHQLSTEKRRTTQLNLLAELSHQLEAQLDPPVAAQLAVNTLQRALDCKHVAVFENEIERREFAILSSAGSFLPPGYRQSTSQGLLGRTLRLRKTQIANDTELDPDFVTIGINNVKSIFCVPLIYHGHVKAILEVGDDETNRFSSHDVHLAEMISLELIRAWERSSYHQRLTNLIKAGIALSPLVEPQTTIKEIATIARETLQARFTFVTLLDQEGNFSRTAYSGNAPRLLNSLSLNPVDDTTVQAALHAYEAFRIRDVRKYRKASHIEIDHNGLRSLLAIPIRLHRLSIGAILAFGKQGEIFFSENDESLASLLSSQAATAVEATWLYQELRNTLSTTTQLYNLSVKIIQAEELQQAARHIAETAAKVASATVAGIVLFNQDQEIETEVEIDENGAHPGTQHPMDLIQQTLQSGQIVHVTPDQISATICFPLQTPLRKYGALWLDVPKIREYFSHHASNMQTLANQAILALERSILLVESQQQAKEIEAAYEELELAYDRTLAALMSALDARDRETEGHSTRVSDLACHLGAKLGLNASALKAMERGSLLHDIGKIGISDTILHKPASLSNEEWKIMRLHPDIGARIVEDIPFLQETLPIIRYHQERWNGSGYPVGLSGKDIPFHARIFAVADAFDALISNRPYRKAIPVDEAVAYLEEQAGVLFDPDIVSVFVEMLKNKELGDLS